MKKKGFTVVELVICFALISVVVVGMLTIALSYRKNVSESEIRLELEEYKVNITRKIQDDIINLGVEHIKYCDTAVTDCAEIVFVDGTSKKLEISSLEPGNRYIRYGGEKFKIEDDLEGIENPTLKDVATLLPLSGISLSVSFQNNSSTYRIDIPITHIAIEGEYGIHIVANGTGSNPGIYLSEVTFDPNGGVVTPRTKQVTFGHPYSAPDGIFPTPTREYYNFIGWYSLKTGGTPIDAYTTVDKIRNHTIYARWAPKSYTVTFDPTGGSVSPTTKTATYTYNYGELPTPKRTGYTFTGWYTQASGGSKVDATTKVTTTSNHTLYARWKTHTYTVKYNGNGATSGSMTSTTHTYDVSKTLPPNSFTRTNYKFIGWNTKADGSGITYIDQSSVKNLTTVDKGTVNLYAQWKINNFKVTILTGEGISSVSGNGEYTPGTTVRIDAQLAANSVWIKWTGYQTSTSKSFSFVMPEKNVTFTANAHQHKGKSGQSSPNGCYTVAKRNGGSCGGHTKEVIRWHCGHCGTVISYNGAQCSNRACRNHTHPEANGWAETISSTTTYHSSSNGCDKWTWNYVYELGCGYK